MLRTESSYLQQARAKAIAALGEEHVLHPNYKPDPRHSLNPQKYLSARNQFVQQVREQAEQAAQQSRGRNLLCS